MDITTREQGDGINRQHIPIEPGVTRFGMLLVISKGSRGRGRGYWLCQCDCGSDPKEIYQGSMRRGKTISCGCYSRQAVRSSTSREKPWTPKEDCYLKEHLWNFGTELVATELSRTTESTLGRATVLGLLKPELPATEEEDRFIEAHFCFGVEFLATRTGRSPAYCLGRMVQLGVLATAEGKPLIPLMGVNLGSPVTEKLHRLAEKNWQMPLANLMRKIAEGDLVLKVPTLLERRR